MNNKKTIKTLLFASLIAVMVLPFATSDLAYGFTDEYTKKWEKLDEKLIKVEEKIVKIEEKLENEDLSAKKVFKLEKKLTKLLAKEARLIEKINVLEQKSIDSFKVDPDTEAKLLAAEKFVYDKYINPESYSYIGENPMNTVIVDFQDKQLVILVDETPQTSTEAQAVATVEYYLKDMMDTGIKMEVEIAEFTDASCRSRTSNCSPMVGGISVAKSGVGTSGDSTLGFKATNTSGKTGFVIAGHAANVGDSIYQKAGGINVGTVISESNACDCAFVESSRSMTNGIWKNYRQSYSITDYAVTSDFVYGKFLKKSGITTGVTYGSLISTGGDKTALIRMSSSSGDSGSPVFTTSGNNAELFGMIVGNSGSTYSMMEPYAVIKSALNLQ